MPIYPVGPLVFLGTPWVARAQSLGVPIIYEASAGSAIPQNSPPDINNCVFFGGSFPLYRRSYGDGTFGRQPIVNSSSIRCRYFVTGLLDSRIEFIFRDPNTGIIYELDANGTGVTTVPQRIIGTGSSSPLSGRFWTADDLFPLEFGFAYNSGPSADPVTIRGFSIEVLSEGDMVGETRARLRDAQGQPAFFCAICSLPFPRSDLIKVVDPDHPHLGRLVCKKDYDGYYPPEDSSLNDEDDTDREMR